MKLKTIIAGLVVLMIMTSIFTVFKFNTTKVSGTDVSGTQTGLWDIFGSPYIVTEDVIIPPSSFLDIRAGVVVKFEPDTKLIVLGRIYANGTAAQPITFTSNLGSPYTYCWGGVKFLNLGSGILQNCSISYARNGIDAEATYFLKIKYCNIYNCENGTRLNTISFSNIENCEIHNNSNNGFQLLWGLGYVKISNNTIYDNKVGMRIVSTFFSTIENNTIYKNICGIKCKYLISSKLNENSIKNINPARRVTSSMSWNEEIEVGDDENDTSYPSSNKWLLEEDDYDDDDDYDYNFSEDDWDLMDNNEKIYAGIFLNRSRANTITNNKITDISGYGILVTRSLNNSFENNNVQQTSENGIYLSAYNVINIFKNNNIININKSAIALNLSSNDNIFINNKITKFNDRIGVEYGEGSYWNVFTSDNQVNGIPLRIYYRVKGNNISSDLRGLAVTEPLMTNLGQIVIIESKNFNINYATLTNGQSGLFLYNARNVTIVNLTIENNNEYAIYFGYNSTDITVVNASITIPYYGAGYFYLEEYANVSLLNTTFDQSKVVYEKRSCLNIQWFLHVKAVESNTMQIIPEANIRVFDVFGRAVYDGKTNEQGIDRYIGCTQKTITDMNTIFYNPYNVTVLKIHYQPGYAGSGVEMDASKWVTVKLHDNQLPSLAGVIDPPITHNRTPKISWYPGSDPDYDVLLYWVKLWNNKQPNIIIEENSTYKTEYNVKTNLSYGERYTVELTASDPYGGWSNSITGWFNVVNHAPEPPEILILPEQTDKRPSKNDDLNCTIVKRSKDNDNNPKDVIQYTYQWYKNDVLQENLTLYNTTQLYHVLDKNYTKTGDTWTAQVSATDGFENVKAEPQAREIMNNPPRVKKTIPILEILEDAIDIGSINLQDIFTDDDNEPLEYSYNITGDNISIHIFQKNGTVIVTPKPNWNGHEDVVFYAFDEETGAYIKTRIKVLSVNDAPSAEIVLPRTDKYFIYNSPRGVNLVGVFDDPDIIFGDELNLTWSSNISGILGHEYRLDSLMLPIGDHRIEFLVRDLDHATDVDSVIIHIINWTDTLFQIPEVKLLEPFNNQTINTTTPVLYWAVVNLNESETERVLFDIYLDTSPIPQNIVSTEYLGNNLTVTGLRDNTTYYWTVIPYLNDFQGICINWVWSFTIDLNFTSIFGVELNMTEDELRIKAGTTEVFNFTIKNTGNIVDNFFITIEFVNNNELINYTFLEIDNITLQPEGQTRINLTFEIPNDYGNTNDMIIITAKSFEPISTFLSRNITIISSDDTNIKGESPYKLPEVFLSMIFWLILIILIIIIILVFLIIQLIYWYRTQVRMSHPIKPKTIIRVLRTLTNETGKIKNADEGNSEFKARVVQKDKIVTEKIPKAKPV